MKIFCVIVPIYVLVGQFLPLFATFSKMIPNIKVIKIEELNLPLPSLAFTMWC